MTRISTRVDSARATRAGFVQTGKEHAIDGRGVPIGPIKKPTSKIAMILERRPLLISWRKQGGKTRPRC